MSRNIIPIFEQSGQWCRLRNTHGEVHHAAREGDWVAFTDCAPADYRRLHRELDDEPCVARYFADKIRHDYDPNCRVLVLRHLMPSSTHDVFISSLVDHIKRWLEAVKTKQQEQHVEEVLSRIKFGSTSDLEIRVPRELTADAASPPASDTYIHSPDGQFLYRGHKHPPFVIEIGYSQKRKDLAGLAKHYYEESDGRIKTVLTVDLEYMSKAKRKALRRQSAAAGRRAPRSREASSSLYRGDECAMSNQLFRDTVGELIPGDGITLHLSDLVPDYVLDRLAKDLRMRDQDADRGQILHQADLTLHVSPQNLFDALAESEAFQEDSDRTYSPSPPPQVATVQPRHKRKVKWELEEDEPDEDEPDECTLPERPASASSKTRRLSPDSRTYASSRRSSL